MSVELELALVPIEPNHNHFACIREPTPLVCFSTYTPQSRQVLYVTPSENHNNLRYVRATVPVGDSTRLGFWWYAREPSAETEQSPCTVLEATGYMMLDDLINHHYSMDEGNVLVAKVPLHGYSDVTVANLHVRVLGCNKPGAHADRATELHHTEVKLEHEEVVGRWCQRHSDWIHETLDQQQMVHHGDNHPPVKHWAFNSLCFHTPFGERDLPMWTLPWAMHIKQPEQVTQQYTLDNMKHALLWAARHLGLTEKIRSPASMSLAEKLELGCVAANLVSLSLNYCVDRQGDKHMDQWAWVTHNPALKTAGADCEDMSEHTLRTLTAMQYVRDAFTDELCDAVQRVLRRYEFGLLVCTLYFPDDPDFADGSKYHCAVMGLDKDFVLKSAASLDRDDVHTDQTLPPCIIETTDFNSCTWKSMPGDISEEDYYASTVKNPGLLMRTPASIMRATPPYERALMWIAPQLLMPNVIEYAGIKRRTAELYLCSTFPHVGVPVKELMEGRAFTLVNPALHDPELAVTPELIESVNQYLDNMPGHRPLPLIHPPLAQEAEAPPVGATFHSRSLAHDNDTATRLIEEIDTLHADFQPRRLASEVCNLYENVWVMNYTLSLKNRQVR